ncbi:TnsA-like heteromeric transposase endonuclease subunit [Pseudonocardia sp. H11422]|uniref:TnsA-like heteromeric transposase endonuclease subunit n=1 Tax=Pseudonocardia sp. H11422 TaxID=2835866 RepID=UPI001BDC537C|nr:TnsA-like heteromeric transposase endonuclease subunit [Pseudonocardia sp. H11422]
MPKLDLVPGGAPAASAERFGVAFANQDGEQRLPLAEAWSVPFESCLPVRGFPSYKGQRNHVGRWWTATTGTLVGYESWLERDRLILLDFDPDTVGIASQPFWLVWTTAEGRARSHAPDYFARLAGGSALVLDCRPAERIKEKDRVAFEATGAACAMLGWRYEVVDAPPATLLANARWLAGYRHPRHDLPEVAAALRAVFAAPAGLVEGAEAVGDPIAVLPVLFHLLWRRELHVDLARPLHPDAVVTGAPVSTAGAVSG